MKLGESQDTSDTGTALSRQLLLGHTVLRRKPLQSSTAEESTEYDSLCHRHLQSPQRRQRQETQQQIRRNVECRTDIEEIDNWEAFSVLDCVCPSRFDRYASEDNGKNRADPETQDDDYSGQDDLAEDSLGKKDAKVGRHDGEFGEGYGRGIGKITSVESFGDSTCCSWKFSKDWREIPKVFAETEVTADKARC